MTRFEDFKQDCLSNGSVTCDWSVLHGYLMDHTIADNWWVLTREERVSICNAVCHHWFDTVIEKHGYDSDGDGIPDEEWLMTPCTRHSRARYFIFNQKEYIESDEYGCLKNCYYYIRDDGWHSFEYEGYKLPCQVVYGYFPDAGSHSINAIQIGEDVTKIYNWYLVDGNYCNNRPGHPLFMGIEGASMYMLLHESFMETLKVPPNILHCVVWYKMEGGTFYHIAHFDNIKPEDWNEEEYHNTLLSISIINADGDVITEADVGETVYVYGTLEDAEDGSLIQGADIHLVKDGTVMDIKDITDIDGEYVIPYTVVEEYKPSVVFRTKFEGGEV